MDVQLCNLCSLASDNPDKEQLLNSKQMYKWYVAKYDVIRDECEFRKPQITQVTAYTDAEQEKIDEVRTDCKDYYNEMRSKFVTGAGFSFDFMYGFPYCYCSLNRCC